MGLSRYLLPLSWRRKFEWMMMNPKPPLGALFSQSSQATQLLTCTKTAQPRHVRVEPIPSAPNETFRRRRRSRAARYPKNNIPLAWVAPTCPSSSNSEPIYPPPVRPFATPDEDIDTWVKTPPITVHPLLRRGRIIWDTREEPHRMIINQPPFSISTPLYLSANVAEQAVLCKGITHISIYLGHKAIISLERTWGPIIVSAFQGKEVLVVDILRAIYAHFHRRLTKSEMRIFSSDPGLARTLERQKEQQMYCYGGYL